MDVGWHAEWLVIGAILLALSGLCWSGLWKSWVQAGMPMRRSTMITLLPGVGVFIAGLGAASMLPVTLALVVGSLCGLSGVILIIFVIVEPTWWGPKWYRRLGRAFSKYERINMAWLLEDRRRTGETSREATERLLSSERPLPPTIPVRLIMEPSHTIGALEGRRCGVMVYPQAPVFATGPDANGVPIERVIPVESLVAVERLPPGVGTDGVVRRAGWRSRLVSRVRVDTTEGVWLFESRHSRRIARAVRQRYLDDSRDIYGMPLAKGEQSDGEHLPATTEN